MDAARVETFKTVFSGEVILPGDAEYAAASNVFLATGAPGFIVRPKTSADVVAAITLARENSLMISVRSGGHSGAGFSTNTGGIVIDMQHFNTVELIDEAKHIVRVGAGGKWKETAQKLQAFGLAISSGDTGSVGVGGLTLGGGIGWMVRKYGMTLDHLVAAEVVTADGKVLRASATENPDLFWAIRGGGGNFGVVTYFEFAAHPVGKIFFGSIVLPPENMVAVLKGWRDYMRKAPLELTSTIMPMPEFGGNPPAIILLACYAGDDQVAADAALAPLRKLDTPRADTIALKEYPAVLEEAMSPTGMTVIASNAFIPEFTDEIIEAIAAQKNRLFQIRGIGGAMNDVAVDATAFPHRTSEVLIVSPTFMPPNVSAEQIAQALISWNDVAKFGKGMYGNLLSLNTINELKGTYLDTYAKLAEIKKKYDPDNIFTMNYNVKPM